MKYLSLILSILITTQLPSLAQTSGNAQSSIKGDFALKNVHTGKYVRIKDANSSNGTPIVAYSPVNWKCVTWEFQPTPSGAHTLKNLFSGKTLQPLHGDPKPGASLEEQPIGTTKAQEYEVIPAGKDQYYVKLKGTDLYLTPSDPDGATNTNILLQPKQDGDLQRWTLIEQHPTM
ncbi:MAG: RICIN domain-containing protein [Bacteroidetes bacterium]|nr:RICIN domain-containing protein [Bacteroidota bacterium]